MSGFGTAQQYYTQNIAGSFVDNLNRVYYVRLTSGFDFGGTFNPTIASVRIAYRVSQLP